MRRAAAVTAGHGIGVTTSPSQAEMIKAARLILDNCGIAFGQNRIVRLVLEFKRRAPQGSGSTFFSYLAAKVQLSAAQQRDALRNPDIARCISYADPTGETAVNNVLQARR